MRPEDFTKQLEKLRENMPVLFNKMLIAFGQGVRTETILRFNKPTGDNTTGIAPSGKPWTPLAPLTLTNRKKEGKDANILRDTGHMYNSLNVQIDPANLTVSVGFSDQKAYLHQFGGKSIINGKIVDVPARPMLDLNNENRNEQSTINEGIVRFMKEFDKMVA